MGFVINCYSEKLDNIYRELDQLSEMVYKTAYTTGIPENVRIAVRKAYINVDDAKGHIQNAQKKLNQE